VLVMSKTILVTGGAGFIGSNLVEALLARNFSVKVIDDLSVSDANLSFIKKMGAEFYKQDISKFSTIKNIFKDVELVFHLAAMNRAQKSIQDPLRANEVNITGTLNVLESSRQAGVKKVVNVSSSSVYKRKGAVPLKENDFLEPPHPYGVGKLAGDHYARIYHELYGVDTTTLRYFSVYGPRQLGNIDKAGVIAKFIHLIQNNLQIEVYGDGAQTRNFTYVSDVVDATIKAGESSKSVGETFNLASDKEVSVNNLINMVEKHTCKKANVKYGDKLKGDPDSNPADISKAKKILGFSPRVNIDEGIRNTVRWYNENKI